jgi:cytochrome c-type protein NapC
MKGVDPGWKVPAELMGRNADPGWHERAKLAAYLGTADAVAVDY